MCVCVSTFFISFSAANRRALTIGYISSTSKLNLYFFFRRGGGSFFVVGGGGESSKRRVRESKTQRRRRRRRKNRQTWRRKRAFILRSNHGSSWYAGKSKGGRAVAFEGLLGAF